MSNASLLASILLGLAGAKHKGYDSKTLGAFFASLGGLADANISPSYTSNVTNKMSNQKEMPNGQTELFSEIKNHLEGMMVSFTYRLDLPREQSEELESLATRYATQATQYIEEKISLVSMRNKLSLLFEYERHYLDLIKEYKEEIKFASSLQEDIRKERSNFFATTLREVYATLQTTKVGTEMEALWLEKLVASYTESLDLSAELAKEQTLSRFAELKEESKSTKETIEHQ